MTNLLLHLFMVLSTYHTFAAGRYSHRGRRQIDSTAESANYMSTRDNHVVGVMSRCESNKSRTGMLGGGWERGYLSSCSSSTPCFLLCPGLTQPVLYLLRCFNSVPGALSRSILRFSLRLHRCLRGSLREHDCATSMINPRSFTLRTSISTTP